MRVETIENVRWSRFTSRIESERKPGSWKQMRFSSSRGLCSGNVTRSTAPCIVGVSSTRMPSGARRASKTCGLNSAARGSQNIVGFVSMPPICGPNMNWPQSPIHGDGWCVHRSHLNTWSFPLNHHELSPLFVITDQWLKPHGRAITGNVLPVEYRSPCVNVPASAFTKSSGASTPVHGPTSSPSTATSARRAIAKRRRAACVVSRSHELSRVDLQRHHGQRPTL